MIGIIDYGVGNIRAIANIYKNFAIDAQIVSTADGVIQCDKLILPGVGAFDGAMKALNNSGMREALDGQVLDKKVPVIGICVGMQMLAKSSEEGKETGLAYVDAKVKKFDPTMITHSSRTKLPHMGWNEVKHNNNPLFEEVQNLGRYYFLHSYYFQCNDDENIIATSVYGQEFTCAIQSENVYGTQFHPEKSHQNGENLLKNFALKIN